MRVAIYIRVSTKLQEDKYSLPAQRLELTRYAESMGWTIVGVFEDVDSGTKLDKEGLVSMLSVVKDGLVDVVLFIEQDRLSRLDTVAWEYLKGILRENNVKIAEPGSITDLSDSKDEFISDLKNLLARQARADLLQKMMRGKRQRTREGKPWGRQPEEYHYDKNTEELTINEQRAWIIPFIDDLYVNKGYSTTGIARELNKRCKTVEGKQWTDSQVRDKLRRKSYHGVMVKKFVDEIIEEENVYPQLRTPEMYEQIQMALKERYRRGPTIAHFLRDVKMTCSSCGRVLAVKSSTSYGKDGKTYPLFVIRHSREDTQQACEAKPYINTKKIEYNLSRVVKDSLANSESIKMYVESDFDEQELIALKKDVDQLTKRKESVETKRDKLLDLYLDGIWGKDELDSKKEAFEDELKQIEKEISERTRKMALIQNKQINYDTVIEFLSVADRYDELLDVEEQQRLIGSLFPNATLDPFNNILTLHAALPEEVTVDIKVKIETTKEMQEREMLELAKIRYDKAQQYLNQNKGTSLEALGKVIGSHPTTLKLDQERFGPFKHLALNKLSPELRKLRIKLIKKEIETDSKISVREIERRTEINRKMISKLIKEEGLK